MSFRKVKHVSRLYRRFCSSVANHARKISNEEVRYKRNALFNEERARQTALVTRVEKIQVDVKGPPEECTLVMNKDLSTPYNCAMHIGELATLRSVLASVDGKLWDMHRPLPGNCKLRFLHFQQEDPFHVNKAYWKSCSFLLGLLAEKVLKDEFYVELHSWPNQNVRAGSFVYDADLKTGNWTPKQNELETLSTSVRKVCSQNLPFERLEVDLNLALKIFEDNRFKVEQIPDIASRSQNNSVTLYRVGDHIDISGGPMIVNTSVVGKYSVTGVHPIQTDYGTLHRLQGVSLPKQLPLNNFAYTVIKRRAEKVNSYNVPSRSSSSSGIRRTSVEKIQDGSVTVTS